MAAPTKKPKGAKPPRKINTSVPAKKTGGAMAAVNYQKAREKAFNKRTGSLKQGKAYAKAMAKGSANLPGFAFGKKTI